MEEIKMCEMSQLVYDFREHGIYNQNHIANLTVKKITLTIDTLQLECDYITGELLSVSGYFPLFRACRSLLEIPSSTKKEFIARVGDVEYIPGMAYDYFKFYPESKKYFINGELPKVTYDEKNKRILIGDIITPNGNNIQINKNIICALDEEGNLKALMLLLDEVIKE